MYGDLKTSKDRLKRESVDDVAKKLKIAKTELVESLRTRFNIDRVLNQLIWGNSNGSHHNCPPGYDNEGNSTPNNNF